MNKGQPINKHKNHKECGTAQPKRTTCARKMAVNDAKIKSARPAEVPQPRPDKIVPFDAERFRAYAGEALGANGIDTEKYYTQAQQALYIAFFEKLFRVNAYMNLTAIRNMEEATVKHLVDSLTVADLLPKNARVLDVGCGGGFPSVPLAIARPDLRVIAFDATAKKVNFVKEVGEELALANLSTAVGRAEEYAHKNGWRASFDAVVSRAVANMAALAQITLPFVTIGGEVFAMKGPNGPEEYEAAKEIVRLYGGEDGSTLQHRFTLVVPCNDCKEDTANMAAESTPLPCPTLTGAVSDNKENERVILRIRKAFATPDALPGTWAQISDAADKANVRK